MTERKTRQMESNRRSMRMIVLILQLGLTMLTCIFLCGLAGRLLGERLGTPLIFPFFLVVGILAGFRSAYRLILKFTSLKNPENAGLASDFKGWAEDYSGSAPCDESGYGLMGNPDEEDEEDDGP